MNRVNNLLHLNDSFVNTTTQKAKDCGLIDFYCAHINGFPPAGPFPETPDVSNCDVVDDFFAALTYTNPCTNPYHIIDVCPYLFNVIGFNSYAFTPTVYFNRSDVQKALHVPPTTFSECSTRLPGLLYNDTTLPPSWGPLPRVINRLNKTIISNGDLDFVLLSEGALLVIQNMTWQGKQGFQSAPSPTANLFVPYHPGLAEILLAVLQVDMNISVPFTENAGAGLLGTTHTERSLTYVNVFPAGHMLPQYAPGAAYRILEFMLGRIESLEERGDFTTQNGKYDF